MKPRAALTMVTGLTLISFVLAASYWLFLPDLVPVHWNIRGQIDGYAPKFWVLVWPFIAFALAFALLVWPNRNRDGETWDPVLNLTAVLMAGLSTWIHWLTLHTAKNPGFPAANGIVGAVFILFAVLGTQMHRLQPNPWAGIRVKWTLKDPVVWKETHRLAGKLMTGGGLLGVAAMALGAPFWLSLVVLFGSVLAPLPYAYRRYHDRHPVGL